MLTTKSSPISSSPLWRGGWPSQRRLSRVGQHAAIGMATGAVRPPGSRTHLGVEDGHHGAGSRPARRPVDHAGVGLRPAGHPKRRHMRVDSDRGTDSIPAIHGLISFVWVSGMRDNQRDDASRLARGGEKQICGSPCTPTDCFWFEYMGVGLRLAGTPRPKRWRRQVD